MSSPSKDGEAGGSGAGETASGGGGKSDAGASGPRPPAKRRLSSAAVIEISDSESDDSDVCAVNSYQASADEVKRIRGEYSSTSSSSDYSSDSESPWEDDSVLLDDKYPVKMVKAQLNPRANRMDNPQFNPALKSQELIDKVSAHWKERKDYESDELCLNADPFRLCQLHNVLANPDIINNIVDDMNTLDWNRKKLDLYEFHQTTDLANLSWQRSIRCIYQLLKTEIMQWVSEVTGLQLNSVSASCSLYGPGDHLLLHDDLLADRRVAFILYLAPWTPRARSAAAEAPAPSMQNGAADDGHDKERECPGCEQWAGCACAWRAGRAGGWSRAMGGALELFARDERGRPAGVARRVLPRNNMLAFFAVGRDSFHQVGEVLSLELPRLSINGWFHGPEPGAQPDPDATAESQPEDEQLEDELPVAVRPHNDVVVVSEWLASAYMCPRARAQVAAQMERCSEVCLHDALQPARAQALLDALRGPGVEWERVGSGQQRRYERVRPEWAAAALAGGAGGGDVNPAAGLLQLAGSAAFLRLLTDLTDLPLVSYRGLELQRWRAGDFTLIPPRAHYASARLEALLYLAAPARALRGGHTVYLAPEEAAEPLVEVPPRHNALSLVYCDAGAAGFTKYLSRLAMPPGRCFYILAATYCE